MVCTEVFFRTVELYVLQAKVCILVLNIYIEQSQYLGHSNVLIPQINVLCQKKLRPARVVEL